MSLIFLVKSTAYSWKMSTVGQVLWKRRVIAPCARTMAGKPSVAAVPAAAALPKNLRREPDWAVESMAGWVFCFTECLLLLLR